MPVTSRTFKSGNSDAVRLPKEITFGPGVEVEIERNGDVVTMTRKQPTMKAMLAELRSLPKPAKVGVRKEVDIPLRRGL
jgi:antitoxin VapB